MSLTAFNRRRREQAALAASLSENEPTSLDNDSDLQETTENPESSIVEDILVDDTAPTSEVVPTIEELKLFAEENKIDLGITFTVNGALKKIKKAGFEYLPKSKE